MSGGGGDFAPTDEAGFVEFARSLPNRQIYDLITSSEPMSPIVGYRRTENRWRHYEHTRSLPDGFVVIGDAACAFNPVYGQGITVAAMSALELGRSLAKGGNIPRRFHRRQARLITAPWRLATGEDVRFRNVEGGASGRIERIMHWYVHHLMAAATHDAIARDGLLRVFGMVSKPHLLFRFSVLWRVLKEALLSRDRSVGDAPVWGPTTTDPVRPARLVGGQVPEKFHARSMG
jgi:2-polyprenyl-6-methoxyphenol hydroxylase-like FAD-dependent oxidoreductase